MTCRRCSCPTPAVKPRDRARRGLHPLRRSARAVEAVMHTTGATTKIRHVTGCSRSDMLGSAHNLLKKKVKNSWSKFDQSENHALWLAIEPASRCKVHRVIHRFCG